MDVTGIIVAVGGFISVIFGFYQYTFNKKTDYKLEQQRKEDEARFEKIEQQRIDDAIQAERDKAKLSSIYSQLYSYLQHLLFTIDADRIFIMQPHPLIDKQYISVSIEVTHPTRDVTEQKDNFQMKRMSEWVSLVSRIGNEDWMIYRSIGEIKDAKIFSEVHRRGVKTLVFRRMVDEKGSWEGTLCAEYTHSRPDNLDHIKGEMTNKANLIADILPEYCPMTTT